MCPVLRSSWIFAVTLFAGTFSECASAFRPPAFSAGRMVATRPKATTVIAYADNADSKEECFSVLQEKLIESESKLKESDSKLKESESTFMNYKLDTIDDKIDTLAKELNKIDGKIDTVARDLNGKIDTVSRDLKDVAKDLNGKIDTVAKDLNGKIETLSGKMDTELGTIKLGLVAIICLGLTQLPLADFVTFLK
jgi:uncharacterized phage infection (PIP) family protein YhgE